MEKTVNKIVYLDGIRGVAAFLVFFHHFLLAFFSAYYSFDINATNFRGWDVRYGQSLFSVFSNGNFCVCIFFVLSGFVLSRKYFQSQKLEVVISGAQRRFLRLYVPVASTMIIAYLMIKAGLFFNAPVSHLRHSEWWFGGMWDFPEPLQRLWICLKFSTMFGGDSAFDTSLWTMAIEFTDSLFVFAFLAFTHNTKNRFVWLILVFLYSKFTISPLLATFVFGISLNYVEQIIAGRSKYLLSGIALLLFPLSLILGSYPSTGNTTGTFFEHLGHTLLEYKEWFHTVGAYFLVLSFVLSKNLQQIISLKIFRFLGYISFSFYLLHPLIIGSLSSWLYLKMHIPLGHNRSVVYIFFITTGFCLLVSWLMAKYIDDPGIRLSKYVYNRWFKKSHTPPLSPSPGHD